jgi:hypothetical protein
MKVKSLDDILGDCFEGDARGRSKGRQPVTFWLTPEEKALYDELQEMSGRKFSKKARDAVLTLMEHAKARAGAKAS